MAKKKKASLFITTENLLDPDFPILDVYKEVEERYNLSLIRDFLMLSFTDPIVNKIVSESLPVLLYECDLTVITGFASYAPMYRERTFWKQIEHWRAQISDGEMLEEITVPKSGQWIYKDYINHPLVKWYAKYGIGLRTKEYYQGDPDRIKGANRRKLTKKEIDEHKKRANKARQCLEAVKKGFARCLLPTSPTLKGKGRPRKKPVVTPRKTKDFEEYNRWLYMPLNSELELIENELEQMLYGLIKDKSTINTRIKQREKQLMEGNISIDQKKGIKTDEDRIKETRNIIKSSLEKYVALKRIDISDKELVMLANLDTTSQIAKGILAIREDIKITTLDNKLSDERKYISDLFPNH